MYRGLPERPAPGPVKRILGAVAAVAVIALAAALGVVVLAVLLGLAAIGAVIVTLRVWWLRRQLRQAAKTFEEGQHRRDQEERPGGHIIEGEYTRRDADRERDR